MHVCLWCDALFAFTSHDYSHIPTLLCRSAERVKCPQNSWIQFASCTWHSSHGNMREKNKTGKPHSSLSPINYRKKKKQECWLLTLGIITSYTLFSDLSQHRNHLQSCPPTTNALHITFVYIHTFMAFLHGEHSFWSIHSEYSNNNEHLWKIENM